MRSGRLRVVRRKLAEGRGLPAYCILHDSALRQMAREYPETQEALASIPKVGPKRAAEFGSAFIGAITEYLRNNPHTRAGS